jgi:hypothetical protein
MIITWFPWLERLSIAAAVSGLAILGATRFGPPGLVLGAVAGMFIGFWSVKLPLVLWARWRVNRVYSLSSDDVLAMFVPDPGFGQTRDFQTAMAVLKDRGADVEPLLPVILDLMGSPTVRCRSDSWATFHEGFAELRDAIGDYNPHEARNASISVFPSTEELAD